MRYFIILFWITVTACFSPLFARTRHVPAEFQTIAEAITAAEQGDSVLVAPGKYIENINFLGKAIVILSAKGPDSTIIDGDNFAPCVSIVCGEGEESRIIGFTLQNGVALGDGYGGGIIIERSSPEISGNIIRNCYADSGGGGISVAFDNCHPFIHGNIIMDNSTPHSGGGVSFYQSSGMLINNTIVYNSAGENGGGISLPFTTDVQIINNIVWNNRGGGVAGWEAITPNISYNDVFDNNGDDYSGVEGGDGSIAADPLLVAPDSGDFSLQGNSPCVDAGLYDVRELDPDGSCADIGAIALHQRDLLPSVRLLQFRCLDYGDSMIVHLGNIGKTPLHLTGFNDDYLRPPFWGFGPFRFPYIEPENPIEVEPGSNYDLWIYFDSNPQWGPYYCDSLIISSDDFDEPELVIVLTGSRNDGITHQPSPAAYDLLSAFPNPFNNTIRFSYTLSQAVNVRLSVLDIMGKEVASWTDPRADIGSHSVVWEPVGLPTGVYLVQLQRDSEVTTRKIVLMK